MNKSIITTIILLSFLTSGFAAPVTQRQARRVAESFFSSQPQTRASEPVNVRLAWHVTDSETQSDLLYVFDNPTSGGYVIVSGEDAGTSVLGFSSSGSFPANDMPEAMRGLLNYYEEVIRASRKRRLPTASSAFSFNPNEIVRLKTANWSQGSPYNAYCPVVNGERCVTGCVATAIGIIMNYHRWPEKGEGDLPSYSYSYGGVAQTIPGHSLGQRYDWTAMNEGGDYDQIARLLYDVGVMVRMMYTPSESGASPYSVKKLSQYFGYAEDIWEYERASCTDSQWEQLIRSEIDAGRPVLYSGGHPQMSGHAMVIDGYCGRYFGVNFGWSGAYVYNEGYSNPNQEGHWFVLTPMEGLETEMLQFNRFQYLYCNIKPNDGGGIDESFVPYAVENMGLPYDFSVGKEFTIHQMFHTERAVQGGYALFDREGNVKERITGSFSIYANGALWGKSFKCTIHQQPKDGDWISPFYEKNGQPTPLQTSRFSVFKFRKGSPREEIRVGFVTQNDSSVDGFLMDEIRYGFYSLIQSLKDYLYFRCYKDFVWELLKSDAGSTTVVWSSETLTYNWIDDAIIQDGRDRFRCMSKYQEDVCYHMIHLEPGDYILRIKNPLIGDSVSLNLKI